jgi:adenosine deaminase
LQDSEALEQIAEDYVSDLVADGVIYADIRFASEHHVFRGLTMTQVVDAVARCRKACNFDPLARDIGVEF